MIVINMCKLKPKKLSMNNYECNDGQWYLRRPNHDNTETGYDLVPIDYDPRKE